MAQAVAPPDLPPKYYLHNFSYLLQFVEEMYANILTKAEQNFIESFRQLPENAQCLYVRMLNRKGYYFRPATFKYTEIEQLPVQLELLYQQAFAAPAQIDSPEQQQALLRIFNREELIEATCHCFEKPLPRSLKRAVLVERLLDQLTTEQLSQCLLRHCPVTEQLRPAEAERFMYFFFGTPYQDMTAFVLRDLGNSRYETQTISRYTPLFHSRKQADDKLWAMQTYSEFKQKLAAEQPTDWFAWLQQHSLHKKKDISPQGKPVVDRLLLKAGRALERAQMPEQALEIYSGTAKPPSRERQVRILHKLGQQEQALQLCQHICTKPVTTTEALFAADFEARVLRKSKKSTTEKLNNADSISIDSRWKYRVEEGALQHFKQRGEHGFFAENHLWRSFFGLYFWDVIFDEEAGAFHHPLQAAPSDLYGADFLLKRKKQFEQKLKLLSKKKLARAAVAETWHEKFGIINPFVSWHENAPQQVERLITSVPARGLQAVCAHIAENVKENSRGFPDLFLWRGRHYRFVEIKSPTDHLSNRQLGWLSFFEQHNIRAQVIRVQWQ